MRPTVRDRTTTVLTGTTQRVVSEAIGCGLAKRATSHTHELTGATAPQAGTSYSKRPRRAGSRFAMLLSVVDCNSNSPRTVHPQAAAHGLAEYHPFEEDDTVEEKAEEAVRCGTQTLQ